MKRIIVQFINELDFVIVYQSDRANFGIMQDKSSFYTEDFSLISAAMPQANGNSCYVRGDHEEYDTMTVKCLNKNWKKRLLATVKAYNEFFK